MTETPSGYVHGTAPEEQRRLTRMNQLLNQSSLAEMRLNGEKRLLDVGSGLGQFTRALARAAGPGARVVGVERSAAQIAEARRQAQEAGEADLVELRPGDAIALPLADVEWGSFDLAHARFVLEHLSEPARAVREMVRAVRPGGRIVLEDDDHEVLQLGPEPSGFAAIWRAYIRTYERNGNDPYVGRHLIALLHECGAKPVRNTMLFFGSCAGHPDMELLVENVVGVLEGARQAILATGDVDADRFGAGMRALREWGERPDASIWFARSWAEGVRP